MTTQNTIDALAYAAGAISYRDAQLTRARACWQLIRQESDVRISSKAIMALLCALTRAKAEFADLGITQEQFALLVWLTMLRAVIRNNQRLVIHADAPAIIRRVNDTLSRTKLPITHRTAGITPEDVACILQLHH